MRDIMKTLFWFVGAVLLLLFGLVGLSMWFLSFLWTV